MPVHRVRATAKHSDSPSKLRSPKTPRLSTGSQDFEELRCLPDVHKAFKRKVLTRPSAPPALNDLL